VKLHIVIAAKIAERNLGKKPQAYTVTRALDQELEVATRDTVDPDQWAEPPAVNNPHATPEAATEAVARLGL